MMEPEHDRNAFSTVMITLLKGVVYADDDPGLWQHLLDLQSRIRDYLREIGIEVMIFEDEGFAWLRTAEAGEGEREIPRLIHKRQLSYPVSLLLALLRRRLAEHDASSDETRLIMDRSEVTEMIETFLPSGTDQVKVVNRIDSCLNKAAELGFIRFLRTDRNKIEVRRILKAFVDAQWLDRFDARLKEYCSPILPLSDEGGER